MNELIIVMGGSFNPPTIAHQRLLLGAVKELGADKGIFVPSSHTYVSIKMRRAKLPKEVLRQDVRLRMLNAMCEDDPRLMVDDCEFHRTEKGYTYTEADLARGLQPAFAMGKVCALLLERYHAGQLPLTVQSMDNCSHNGDKVKAGVFAYAERWVKDGLVPEAFVDYLKDETKVTFPWSMIDKITTYDEYLESDVMARKRTVYNADKSKEDDEIIISLDENEKLIYYRWSEGFESGTKALSEKECREKVEKFLIKQCIH